MQKTAGLKAEWSESTCQEWERSQSPAAGVCNAWTMTRDDVRS